MKVLKQKIANYGLEKEFILEIFQMLSSPSIKNYPGEMLFFFPSFVLFLFCFVFCFFLFFFR